MATSSEFAAPPRCRNAPSAVFRSEAAGKLSYVTANTQQQLVERIHSSGKHLVLSITGGGSGAIAALLEVPGASATVLEAVVPYAATALDEWLGGPVDHYCSERTARAMAMAAFERARRLSDADPHLLRGIGATASLASTRPKRGRHRIHVAWQSTEVTTVATCELPKGERTRAGEEHIATQLIVSAVAEACGIEPPVLDETICDSVDRRQQQARQPWTELLLGRRTHVAITEHGTEVNEGSTDFKQATPKILFPGAFNPLHAGHVRMAEVASERCGGPVTFELSIANVDKPPLDFIEISDRLQPLSGRRVLLTRAPTFVEKARLVPGCVFVVGIDTIERIGEPRYYGGDVALRDAAIDTIARLGCRFLVFGRSTDKGFRTLSDFSLPPQLRTLCDEVPESVFRQDVSSTEQRGA